MLGVGSATVLSQFVQAVFTLWYFKKKSPDVKIGRIRIDGTLLPRVLAVGVSAMLMQALTLVQQTVIYRVAAQHGGESSQIVLGAALRFWNFAFVPLWGISNGFQPAPGTNYSPIESLRMEKPRCRHRTSQHHRCWSSSDKNLWPGPMPPD